MQVSIFVFISQKKKYNSSTSNLNNLLKITQISGKTEIGILIWKTELSILFFSKICFFQNYTNLKVTAGSGEEN